jgi:hypothetical protein
MSRPVPWRIFTSYAVAWLYLAGFSATAVAYAALSPHDQAAVLGWASTNVHNLRRDPLGCLVASAFVTQTFAGAWPALIVLAMFGANRVLGNWRTALVCAAGHVIGTLVSEGIVGYRVSRGLLPASSRYIIDVGPSYVVVSAIVVALLYGSWLARTAAAVDLTLLVVVGNIFGGLSNLDVAAVGHLTAMIVAAAVRQPPGLAAAQAAAPAAPPGPGRHPRCLDGPSGRARGEACGQMLGCSCGCGSTRCPATGRRRSPRRTHRTARGVSCSAGPRDSRVPSCTVMPPGPTGT